MIRKLVKEDRNVLKKILEDTDHFNEEEINVAMELIDVYLNNENQKDYIIYVYVDDDSNRTAGYICYGRRPLTEGTYDLYWIAVDPNIHGKGVGSRLVKFMEEDIVKLGGELILIETSGKPEYEGERGFYRKNGYDVQTIIKDFYRKGDDLFIYRKYLPAAGLPGVDGQV
jgi:ribosomal protein S18 acetylase RimI-like enzyme